MALNEVFRNGDFLSLPVPAGTKSGAALRVGGLNVVTQTNVAKTDVALTDPTYDAGGGNPHGYATCWLTGVHELTTDIAVNPGDPVYMTPGGALTLTATGNNLFGHAVAVKAAGAGPARIRLAN